MDIKELEKLVKKALEFKHPHIALLALVRDAVATVAVPDELKYVDNFIGRPRLVAVKDNPKTPPPRDAWGNPITYDSCVAEYAELRGYAGEGEWVFELPDKEKYRNKKFKFFLISDDEQNEIIEFLSKYIHWDVEDYRGTPLLGAIIPLGMKENSPDVEWNKRAKEYYEELEKERKEREKRQKEIALQTLEKLKKEYPGLDFEILNEKEVKVIYKGVFNTYEKTFFFYEFEENRGFNSWWNDVVNRVLKEKEAKDLIEKAKKGEEPIFRLTHIDKKGRKEYCIYLKGGVVEIPKNVLPHFIGKKGKRVKELKRIFGEFTIKEIPEIEIENKYPSPLVLTEKGYEKI